MKFYICESKEKKLYIISELSIDTLEKLQKLNIVGSCFLNDDKLIEQAQMHKEMFIRPNTEIEEEDKQPL